MYLPFIEVGLWETVLILILPLILEFPRVAAKCLVLLYHKFFGRADRWELTGLPTVSIVVPAHNEGEVIEETIESLIGLAYPNKEIIVVDDNSTDDTYIKAKPYAARGEIVLVRKREPRSNKAKAIMYGAKFASGEIIVGMDADTRVQRESLIKIIEPFSDPDVVGVAGNVRVYNTDSILEKIQAYEYLIAMEMGRSFQSMIQVLLVIPGAFGAYRRRVMEAVGGLDEDTITEDFDYVLKLRKTGSKVVFARNAVAWTVVPNNFRGWVRQRTRWAYGQLQTIVKHKDLLFNVRFGLKSMLSVVDMLLMDLLLLFMRSAWFVLLPFIFSGIPVWKLIVLILGFYLILEFVQAVASVVTSPRGRRELSYLALTPIVVLVYRPIYSVVRLIAYVREALDLEVEW
jgi:cellulose synthase/poly-beta-1,6-N-acetylglucosamine synthase-like glycosyltransferase